jgi:hypothetical protein
MKQFLKSLNRKKIAISIVFCLIISSLDTYSQEIDTSGEGINENVENKESVKPLRFGVKLGVPSLFTLNAEYVTPLLDNRVAFAVDYLPFKANIGDADVKLNNFEIGSNVYLKNTGKGIYGGVSYYSFNLKGENITNVDFDDGTTGTGNAEVKFSTVNLKIGAKLGRVFYFRVELGYGFGNLPDTIFITSTDGSTSTSEAIEDEVSFLGAGVPIFNFGIGYSFL